MYIIKIISHFLSYANSCVNPFVYAFLSDGFRKAMRKTFPGLAKRYRIFGGVAEDCGTQADLDDRTELSKVTLTTEAQNEQLIQTDLWNSNKEEDI